MLTHRRAQRAGGQLVTLIGARASLTRLLWRVAEVIATEPIGVAGHLPADGGPVPTQPAGDRGRILPLGVHLGDQLAFVHGKLKLRHHRLRRGSRSLNSPNLPPTAMPLVFHPMLRFGIECTLFVIERRAYHDGVISTQ